MRAMPELKRQDFALLSRFCRFVPTLSQQLGEYFA